AEPQQRGGRRSQKRPSRKTGAVKGGSSAHGTGRWKFHTARTERVGEKRADQRIHGRQNPRLIGQFGQVNFASAEPFAFRSGDDFDAVMKQNLSTDVVWDGRP